MLEGRVGLGKYGLCYYDDDPRIGIQGYILPNNTTETPPTLRIDGLKRPSVCINPA